MKRRQLVKYLSTAPLIGGLIGSGFTSKAHTAGHYAAKRNLIKELGLRTFINAAGTYTAMTASLMPEEVVDAIREASKEFMMLDEVQDKVGEKIASLCRAEAATVTAGCWSALVLGTAGVLTGTDLKKVAQLPDLSGMKSEVIVQKTHNTGYVHALTNTGVKIVEIETPEDLGRAVNANTAMMWFLNANALMGKISPQDWVNLARKHNIPTMIDIAADVPPVENLWKFNEMGFDLVCISGGKAMRGPQSAGILMGRKDLIAAARLSAPPRGGNIGRGMKVNKEEILGMYVALERFIKQDHDKVWKGWESQVNHIKKEVESVAGVSTEVIVPPIANHNPALKISWDTARVKIKRDQLQANLRNGNPSIEVMGEADNILNLTVFMLKPGEEKIVASRIREELTKAS